MTTHWLLVMVFVMNGYGTAKYIEFPTKQACEAAAAAIEAKTRMSPACIEGGKPIPEGRGTSTPIEK